jgi:N-acetylglucosamine repressor
MADQRLAKAVNDRSILTHLRRHGQATRADLARAMQLAPASVTRLTADLIARGLVLERPADPAARAGREAGRPGVDLCLNPGGAYYLGVEIGVTVLRLAVVNLLGQVAHLAEQPLDSADLAHVVAAIAAQAGRLIPDNRFAGRV